MLARLNKGIAEVSGEAHWLERSRRQISPTRHLAYQWSGTFWTELEKPGRDSAPERKTATFREGVESLADLQTGMVLEGVVTNVAAFGASSIMARISDGLSHKSRPWRTSL